MTNNQPPLGQRLKQWREANNLSDADVAQRLGLHPDAVVCIEDGFRLGIGPNMRRDIEALIATPLTAPGALTNEEQWLVDQVVAAVRAGCVVSLIRPATAEYGQVAVTFGDDEWKRWI